MNPEAKSYEQLFLTCRRLHLPINQLEELFRRMVFNYLANNTDDHNKNFSFMMDQSGKWSIAPAYDITFIFNSGGFQAEQYHCMPLYGKLLDWTYQDILHFAEENDINGAEKIITQVTTSISHFRHIAEKYAVAQEWIGLIETCLMSHLREWGFYSSSEPSAWITIDGRQITEVFIEQAYKGNLHLYATIDDKRRKYIIRQQTDDYNRLQDIGLSNLTFADYQQLVEMYFPAK